MRSTDLFSIFLPKQCTILRLRSTSLLSIPHTDPEGASRPGAIEHWTLGRLVPWSIGDWRKGAMEGPMPSTDLFSIFLPKQCTILRLRFTSLLSIPPDDPFLQFPMLQGAMRLLPTVWPRR